MAPKTGVAAFAEELKEVPLALCKFEGIILLVNLVQHVLVGHSSGILVRLFFSLSLLVLFVRSIAAKSATLIPVNALLLWLFNPFFPVRFHLWLLWQAIDWLVLIFMFFEHTYMNVLDKQRQDLLESSS